MNIYNYIPIYMQCRIGSGYYNPIIQSVAEMSGCENRLFLILALCVSGRLIPLAESGGKRVRNQKKIEFRTPPADRTRLFDRTPPADRLRLFDRNPADRMRLLRPHPPADRLRLFARTPPADRMAPAQFIAAPQSNL